MGQKQEKDGSVFDFVYVDRARLGSLLAQLSDDGIVASSKRTSSKSGINQASMKVAAAILSADGMVNDAASEALERSFDASMLLPINALTVLQESGLLHEGVCPGDTIVPLGGIVHLRGFFAVHDIEMVRRLWQPMVQLMLADEAPHNRKAKREQIDLAGKVIKDIPPTVQFSMLTSDGVSCWGLLNDNDPTFSTHNLGLKHGALLQGEWHLIGILDAYPDNGDGFNPFLGEGLLGVMGPVMDELRKVIGRPARAFGVTPLALFRPIGAAQPPEGLQGLPEDA